MATIYVTLKHIKATKVFSECTHCLFGKHALFVSCVLVIKKKYINQRVFIFSVSFMHVLFSISLMCYCAKCYCFQSIAKA